MNDFEEIVARMSAGMTPDQRAAIREKAEELRGRLCASAQRSAQTRKLTLGNAGPMVRFGDTTEVRA